MIPGLMLIEKLVGFGLDLFILDRSKRERLRNSFHKFVRNSLNDSKISSDLHKKYAKYRREKNGSKDGHS